METFSLILLVFVLGIRHGLDADHLAFIDVQTRFNWRMGSPIARWVGTLFSFGHGLTVACVATMLGVFVKGFRFPDFFDVLATWIAIASLFMIGTFNVFNLLRTAGTGGEFQIRGLKGKLLPRIMRETTNPFLIVILGGLFALAADTVSQTSLWALSAANSADYMPFILGGVFMAGMMLTDTLDSLIAYRLISQSGQIGQSTSRLIGWFIVALAYGIASYEAFSFFFPVLDIDFEVVGIICFVFLLSCLAAVAIRRKIKAA